MTGDQDYQIKPGGIIPTDDIAAMSKEINDAYNKYIDNVNLSMNGIYTTSTFPNTGSIVQFPRYDAVKDSTPQEREEAEMINFKKWKWVADKFVANFPKWRIVPDVSDPLRKFRLMHESNQMWIQNCWPNNEIKVVGASTVPGYRDPLAQIGLEFPVHSMHIFERWAFGMEDCPYGK